MTLVLCGPIVRRVERSSCAVFVALSAPGRVTLGVYAPGGSEPLLSGFLDTLRLGEGLHVALVRASGEEVLRWGATYEYDLQFTTGKGSAKLMDPGVLCAGAPTDDLDRLCYPGQRRPSFVLPPADPLQLRLLHGSCRKPHGKGEDALVHADALLLEAFGGRGRRPQLLVLSGDQIYADDVHPALQRAARRLALDMMGTEEEGDDDAIEVLKASSRQALLSQAGLTSTEAACHLVTLGEHYAMYLLAWSASLWDKASAAEPALSGFYQGLRRVRRALANVSTFMLFDDHEITDDWYIRAPWCEKVLSEPLARRVIRNGLAAYALFQHWGNVGPAAQEGPFAELRESLAGWSGSTWDARHATIERLLGIPHRAADLGTLPGVPWSYTYRGPGFELIALDTRTRREFDAGAVSLMSARDIDAALPASAIPLTLVISPAPVLGLGVIERVQKLSAHFDGGIKLDDEPWGHAPTYEHLLLRLLGRGRAVVLSGDVHYGYWALLSRGEQRVVNFVSSALKNSSLGKDKAPPDLAPRGPTFAGREDLDIGWASLAFNCHLAEVGFDADGEEVLQTQWYDDKGACKGRTQRVKFPQ